MRTTQIPFQNTGYFSKLICDYLAEKEPVQKLYQSFPNYKGFENQIQLKKEQFTEDSRKVLVNSLQEQYKNVTVSESTLENITNLKEENSFTVVTGHQLNVFTGPLYFLYKIASTINLAKNLKEKFPKNNFVPVYWMATEDHDFEEINHFFVYNNKISWDVESSGPVGQKSTEGMDLVFQEFSKVIGDNANANYLKELFQKAYVNHSTLTEATRYLVNELFGTYGLVIVDGDDNSLKEEFVPFVRKELLEKQAAKVISEANTFLDTNYKVQVNPREINLFYIKKNLRERIVFEDGLYKINNTDIQFSEIEILEELKSHPECFSPNVIMRPLYQEVVLPNLCYIGGGGELAYWLQLKELFVVSGIPFPVLLLRNSVLLASEKQTRKLSKLNVTFEELFLKQEKLIDKKISQLSTLPLDFSEQKRRIQEIFKELQPMTAQTDISFNGALEAQEKKQLKGLLNLEKRLLKAEKRKHIEVVERIQKLKDELFPRKGLQERNANFAEFYVEYGENLIPTLLEKLQPLNLEYAIIIM